MRQASQARVENIYQLEGRVPIGKAIPFGLQHVLAMFVSNIAPIILVASVALYDGESFTAVEVARLIQNAMMIAGIGDAGATTLASGIREPKQYNINLGTSGWVAAVSDDILLTEAGVFNLAAAAEGCYINVVPFLNAGNVHKWIAGMLGRTGGTADYETVSALLKNSVPGSHGVLFLPYLVGERFPVLDPEARGCFFGITAETTAADLARACLEGVAFSLRQGLEQLPVPPASISLIGGGGREAVWCQILADVLGHDITVLVDTEFRAAQALAALARQGAGSAALTEDGTVYHPRSEYRTLYDVQYTRYQKLYPALQAI